MLIIINTNSLWGEGLGGAVGGYGLPLASALLHVSPTPPTVVVASTTRRGRVGWALWSGRRENGSSRKHRYCSRCSPCYQIVKGSMEYFYTTIPTHFDKGGIVVQNTPVNPTRFDSMVNNGYIIDKINASSSTDPSNLLYRPWCWYKPIHVHV